MSQFKIVLSFEEGRFDNLLVETTKVHRHFMVEIFRESTLLPVRFHMHWNTNGQSMNGLGLASIFWTLMELLRHFRSFLFFRQTFKLWFETNFGLFSRWQGSKHGIFEHHSSAPGISILDSNDRKKSHKTYHQPICREAVFRWIQWIVGRFGTRTIWHRTIRHWIICTL